MCVAEPAQVGAWPQHFDARIVLSFSLGTKLDVPVVINTQS